MDGCMGPFWSVSFNFFNLIKNLLKMKKLFSIAVLCIISIAANATDCIDTANFWTDYWGYDVSTSSGLQF